MSTAPPSLVFLSHASEDRSVAESICAALETIPLKCWMAPRDIPAGELYAQAIVDAINQCRIMVIVFSSSANGSQQVIREVERGVSNGRIMLMPFRVEPVEPSGAMEYFLSCSHWMDAVEGPLTSHLEHLRQRVMGIVAAPGHTEPAAGPEPGSELTLERLQARINASRPEDMLEFIAVFRESLEMGGFSGRAVADAAWVLYELLANAAEHGCGREPSKEIAVVCEVRRTHVRMQVRDPGPGFCAEDTIRELTEHYDVNQTRGRGLIIARFLSQRVTFTDSGRTVEAIVGAAPNQPQAQVVSWQPTQVIGDVVVLMIPEDPVMAVYEVGREVTMMLDLSYRKFAIDWQLAQISSSDLMTIVFLRDLAKIRDAGGRVVLFNVNSRLYALLKRFQFTTLCPVRFSLQDALAYLKEDEVPGG